MWANRSFDLIPPITSTHWIVDCFDSRYVCHLAKEWADFDIEYPQNFMNWLSLFLLLGSREVDKKAQTTTVFILLILIIVIRVFEANPFQYIRHVLPWNRSSIHWTEYHDPSSQISAEIKMLVSSFAFLLAMHIGSDLLFCTSIWMPYHGLQISSTIELKQAIKCCMHQGKLSLLPINYSKVLIIIHRWEKERIHSIQFPHNRINYS